MTPKTKTYVANGLMITGLLPYVAVVSYMWYSSGFRGEASTAAAFTIILGMAVSYVVALVVAYPAALWSRSMAKTLGYDCRSAKVLRGMAYCGVFPVLAIFPAVAFGVLM